MNANPYLELVNRRGDQAEVHVLFVGAALAGAKKVFKRDRDPVKCQHVASCEEALDLVNGQADAAGFDCVMIDMRHENDGGPLNVVALAAVRAANRLVVLTSSDLVPVFEEIEGVDLVLPAPVDPQAIIATIVESALHRLDAESAEAHQADTVDTEVVADVDAGNITEEGSYQAAIVSPDTAPVEPAPIVPDTAPTEASEITTGFETSIARVVEADQHLWQRFVPIANFLYKKLAIVILSALFLAFVAYGLMIVFFMASSSWSMPFELSRGHKLVEKIERDLSLMHLRKNEVQQDTAKAELELINAKREQRDGLLNLTLSEQTIEQEIIQQTGQAAVVEKQTTRLKTVLSDFNSINGKGSFARNLDEAYARRIITRKAKNSGTLAIMETMHRMATVENEISLKRLEAEKVSRTLKFLKSLLIEIKQPEITMVTSPGSELAHLARDVIETKNRIAHANKVVDTSRNRLERFQNSLEVISANINSLEVTPVARAMHAPVTVLFVPYTNADNMKPGTPLYGCKLSIFWCSQVGEVGAPVDGETTSVHPLFGKPMRGSFVEAKFSDPSFITEELVHAGGAPLLF